MDVTSRNNNNNNNITMIQNLSTTNQIQQQDLVSNIYITYENLNKQNHYNEISLKERRIIQQTQWENQLKASYEWRNIQYRTHGWLQRQEKEEEEEEEEEHWDQLEKSEQEEDEQNEKKEQWEQEHLKLFLAVEEFEQDYNEHLNQIDHVEQMNEEEKCKQQNVLLKQLEDLEHYEQREHEAQLKFIEGFEHFQQQQQSIKTQTDKFVRHDENSESVLKNIPIFHRKQTKINQLDLAMNTIFKLIEKYGTPFHVFLRPSIMKNNYDDKDEEEEDEEDNDFNDYDNEEQKDWIKIMDDGNFFKQQQQQQLSTSDLHCMQTTSFELQQQQQRPFICIEKHRYIQSIRRELKRKNYLLLEVYNGNTFYLCERNEMEQKVSEHMARTNAYVLKTDCTQTTSLRYCVRTDLEMMRKRVTTLLDNLYRNNSLTMFQTEQMNIEESKVQMDYLTFQPDIRQQDVHFQPIMTCDLASTINISRHIQRLLQPLYDQAAKSITFFKGVDAIDAIELYVQKGHLRSDTLFITLHINDLCTIFPHEQTIQALENFLNIYLPEREIQGMSIETIIQLVRLVLENQLFLYNNSLYQQIKGCGSGSPLTILLADIYMFYWQQNLVNNLMSKNEIFGRCLDDIFITWNGSIDEFLALLNRTTNQQLYLPSNSLAISIDKTIYYLDTEIGHINGHLQTKVKHNLRIEPYSLPYISNQLLSKDDISTSSSIIREALIRAVRSCSNIIDFEREQYFIYWSFELRNDSLLYKFYNNWLKMDRFFTEFGGPKLYGRNNYDNVRRRVRQYDENRKEKEIERRKHEQKLETWYIAYPFKSKLLTQFKQDFKRFWLRCCNYDNESDLNKFNIKFVRRSNYPSKTK